MCWSATWSTPTTIRSTLTAFGYAEMSGGVRFKSFFGGTTLAGGILLSVVAGLNSWPKLPGLHCQWSRRRYHCHACGAFGLSRRPPWTCLVWLTFCRRLAFLSSVCARSCWTHRLMPCRGRRSRIIEEGHTPMRNTTFSCPTCSTSKAATCLAPASRSAVQIRHDVDIHAFGHWAMIDRTCACGTWRRRCSRSYAPGQRTTVLSSIS